MTKQGNHTNNEILHYVANTNHAVELLSRKNYESLIEFIDSENLYSHPNLAPPHIQEILITIRLLCLTCYNLSKAEVWHLQAVDEVAAQISELSKIILRLFELLQKDNWKSLEMSENLQTNNSLTFNQRRDSLMPDVQNRISGQPELHRASVNPKILARVSQGISDHETNWNYGTSPAEVVFLTENTTAHMETREISTLGKAEYAFQIYGFGVFRAFYEGKLIENWPNRKSKSVFKYLLLNRQRPTPKELIMEAFWPDVGEAAARNNLNVTIYNIRQALRETDESMSFILYEDTCYLLNSELDIWFDYEAFNNHRDEGYYLDKHGLYKAAVYEFRTAEMLYGGELFEEDRYDDWLLNYRNKAQNDYLSMLEYLSFDAFKGRNYSDCIQLCNKILSEDACLEETHRMLMRSYIAQGQNHLAIRQYFTCIETLKGELDVLPSHDTIAIYEQLRASS